MSDPTAIVAGGRRYGAANALTRRTAAEVRAIRLRHLRDGLSARATAREFSTDTAYVRRLATWRLWPHTDHDLMTVEHQPPATPVEVRACSACIHWQDRCSLGFPEARSNPRYASRCSVFTNA